MMVTLFNFLVSSLNCKTSHQITATTMITLFTCCASDRDYSLHKVILDFPPRHMIPVSSALCQLLPWTFFCCYKICPRERDYDWIFLNLSVPSFFGVSETLLWPMKLCMQWTFKGHVIFYVKYFWQDWKCFTDPRPRSKLSI